VEEFGTFSSKALWFQCQLIRHATGEACNGEALGLQYGTLPACIG
jgi:hypothetical protein